MDGCRLPVSVCVCVDRSEHSLCLVQQRRQGGGAENPLYPLNNEKPIPTQPNDLFQAIAELTIIAIKRAIKNIKNNNKNMIFIFV